MVAASRPISRRSPREPLDQHGRQPRRQRDGGGVPRVRGHRLGESCRRRDQNQDQDQLHRAPGLKRPQRTSQSASTVSTVKVPLLAAVFNSRVPIFAASEPTTLSAYACHYSPLTHATIVRLRVPP
eukprot:731448-Prorocentrum_minimum.AAC.1